jgi:hypothetical protein
MNEEVKEDKEEKKLILGTPQDNPEVTKEQLSAQLNYAQKLINILQGKVNDLTGKMVQIEAQLLMAKEDKESMLKQLEPVGITLTE